MLRLTLTAHTPDATTIGYVDILNDGTGMPEYGNYVCELLDADLHPVTHAAVAHFPRYLGAWELVRRAMAALGPLEKHGEVP
jgi:hypothetical protein